MEPMEPMLTIVPDNPFETYCFRIFDSSLEIKVLRILNVPQLSDTHDFDFQTYVSDFQTYDYDFQTYVFDFQTHNFENRLSECI